MQRACARPGCAAPAVATFTYDPTRRVAWVRDLADEVPPGCLALCADHVERFSVPGGWALEDERRHLSTPGAVAPTSPLLARAFRASRAS